MLDVDASVGRGGSAGRRGGSCGSGVGRHVWTVAGDEAAGAGSKVGDVGGRTVVGGVFGYEADLGVGVDGGRAVGFDLVVGVGGGGWEVGMSWVDVDCGGVGVDDGRAVGPNFIEGVGGERGEVGMK